VSHRVRIVCFGSLLAGDDGFGVHLHRALSHDLPVRPGLRIQAIDAGLVGMAALTFFDDCEHVIVVDALGYAGEAGRVSRLTLEDVAGPAEAFSAHALDLNHLFHVLPIVFEGRPCPSVVIIGAEIERPSGAFSMDLSPPIKAAIAPALELIDAELDALARAAVSAPQRRSA